MHLSPRRFVVAVVCLALLVPAAAFAKPLFTTGAYKGGDRDKYLTLTFTAGHKQVRSLKFTLDRFPGKCNTNSTVSGDQTPYAVPRANIGKHGVFTLSLKNSPRYVPSTVAVKAKLKGTKVTGTFRLTLGPTDKGVKCDTGKIAWSGKLVPAKKPVKRK
jgi:hypothetical protein